MKKGNSYRPQSASGVLLASLVLPGLAVLTAIAPLRAVAENPPEKSTIAIKYGTYTDGQPGWDRISADSPQVFVQSPIAGEWAIEGSWVGDSVSGATPRNHTQKSGASRMSDYRNAANLRVTRYLARSAVSASVAYSSEHDYTSNAIGLDGRWSTEDNNRTWTAGYGLSSDRIDTTYSGGSVVDQHKLTHEFMVGVTQVLTPADIAQVNITRSVGVGYYDDPYKNYEKRPDYRNNWVALLRWNHHLDQFDASLRTSYRYYQDTFGVRSHTLGLDWVQPTGKWTFTPGVRYYSQSAANFYFDPVLTTGGQYDQFGTLLRAVAITGDKSADQRLSAFGAVTLSLKMAYAITPDTVVDVKLETYKQQASWHLGGDGSPGLDPFNAQFFQIGLSHKF